MWDEKCFFTNDLKLLTEYDAPGAIKMLFLCSILSILLDGINRLYCRIKIGNLGTLGLTLHVENDKISKVL